MHLLYGVSLLCQVAILWVLSWRTSVDGGTRMIEYGQGHYRSRSPKAPARLVQRSGRDGGGKPRPDYGLPNLTPRTLNVVNVLGRVFKLHPGGLLRFGVQGRWQSGTPPPKVPTASSQGHRRRCIVASTKPEANSCAGIGIGHLLFASNPYHSAIGEWFLRECFRQAASTPATVFL
jgi:hypothetical protein